MTYVPTPTNGEAKPRGAAADPEMFHGVPVLTMRVGVAIPTFRAPRRFAVRVYPDLARYLLESNVERNRRIRPRQMRKYAQDMAAGRWQFTPEPVVFSVSGRLQNGQHRLMAVTEAGEAQWLMFDFGWPDDIITAIDRGAARTNADAFTISDLPNATTMSAAVSHYAFYQDWAGTRRAWSSRPALSAPAALAIAQARQELWARAAQVGTHTYGKVQGYGPALWTAAFVIFADATSLETTEAFFREFDEGTGHPGSATRMLHDWVVRRPRSMTKTGDHREPLELIIRAFNAWRAGKSLAKPKQAGFELSRVR